MYILCVLVYKYTMGSANVFAKFLIWVVTEKTSTNLGDYCRANATKINFLPVQVLMMVLPMLILFILPKMMNASDPETRREMENSMNMFSQNSSQMPDMAEMVSNWFGGSKKKAITSSSKSSASSGKTSKSSKRRRND